MYDQLSITPTEGNEAVLVVEDDASVRKTVCAGLRQRGYEVLDARNGEDALTVADRHNGPIHLVISDIVMPQMNGLQLFARLRGWFPGIRFLFISGYMKAPVDDRDLNNERTSFLSKPFTVTELARESRALLDEARPRVTQARRRLEWCDDRR